MNLFLVEFMKSKFSSSWEERIFWFRKFYGGERDLDALRGEEFCALGDFTLRGA
jgi:hypothetical protein